MIKYLIIDTWNGEGYTDSSVELKEFHSELEAKGYAYEEAENASGHGQLERDGLAFRYELDDDYGAVHWLKFEPTMYGVVLNPNTNEYHISSEDKWKEFINYAIAKGEIDAEEEHALNKGNVHGLYVHNGFGDEGDAKFYLVSELLQEINSTHLKDNEMIMRFMGHQHMGDSIGFLPLSHLKYHKSWDWLMPVVESIHSIDNAEHSQLDCEIYESVGSVDLGRAYMFVVKYIKKHNDERQ